MWLIITIFLSPKWYSSNKRLNCPQLVFFKTFWLNMSVKKLTHSGFLPVDFTSFEEHSSMADYCTFLLSHNKKHHILHNLHPPCKVTTYNMWLRPHAFNAFNMQTLQDFDKCLPLHAFIPFESYCAFSDSLIKNILISYLMGSIV